ncbi:MAG TPA: Ldh family oxidoreductase [Naasia sp.]
MTTTDSLRGPVTLDSLHEHAQAVLVASGVAASHADLVSASLVDAEARGIGSHGLTRLRIYSERVRRGLAEGAVEPQVTRTRSGVIDVDALNALGQVGAGVAVDAAMEVAREAGIALAGVRNSNHCGTLAFFTRRIAEAGLVAIAMSTAPPTMVYFGGRTPAVGTNPFSIAVPRAGAAPLVIDMATSATARGKIIVAEQTGTPIPGDWALDSEGRPTSDPAAALAGSMVPFAGPKGSGLAMMIDLICGGLIASATGFSIGNMYEEWDRPQRVGHAFIVLDPGACPGGAGYGRTVAEFAAELAALPPAEGHSAVLAPGTLEDAALARARANGLEVPPAVLADLLNLAEEVGATTSLLTETRGGAPWLSN